LAFLLLPACSLAQYPATLAVETVQKATLPLEISKASLTRLPEGSPVPLGLRFSLRNQSEQPLHSVTFEAVVIGSDGQFKGAHGFTIRATVPEGEELTMRYSTSSFEVEPGDRITLSATRAEGYNRVWRETAPWNAISKEGPTDTCDSRCSAKDDACTDKCSCGVMEFSCSCGVGTLTYTCKCYRCAG
jgi:hypothetical protein